MQLPQLNIGGLISRLPIIQGGMGVGISLSGLASAVADEGGIGVIAGAMTGFFESDVRKDATHANIRSFKREIRLARKATDGILGVNVMVALTDYPDLVKAAIEEKIDIVFCGAGLPMDLPGFLREGDETRLVPIISSARAARLICKKWMVKHKRLPDAFVVEGPKAGGHLGFKYEQIDDPVFSLENIIPDVLDTMHSIEAEYGATIPVIAAGGIYSGRDIRKFLDMGVAGVQMGTRFVATHECDADEAFKQAYVNATKDDLVIINSPVGLPGRALNNAFIESANAGNKVPFHCAYQCLKTCKPDSSPYCIALSLAAAKKGFFKKGFAFAGSNAYRVDKIISVHELFDSLKAEFAMASG